MAAIYWITIPSRPSCRHQFENLFLLLIFYLIGRHFENHQPLQTIMLDMDLRVHSYFSSVPWPPFLRITFPCRSLCRLRFENLFWYFSSVHGCHFENHHPLQAIMQTIALRNHSYFSSLYGRHFVGHHPLQTITYRQDLRIHSYFLSAQGCHFENHHPLQTIM